VIQRTDTEEETTVSGLLLSVDWDVRFYGWRPGDPSKVEPPTDWERVIAGPPLDEQVWARASFDSGAASPSKEVPSDHFAVVATAQLDLPAGRYDLWVVADDGARIYIDGSRAIDLWSPRIGSQITDIQLEEGRHTVRVEYYEINGPARLDFGIRAFKRPGEW